MGAYVQAAETLADPPARQLGRPVDDGERARASLRQLVGMRVLALASQLATIEIAEHVFGIDLPQAALHAVLAALAVWTWWTWRRLKDPRPVGDAELLLQLCTDVIGITLVLGMTGGASNPFAGIVLLPLALGATSLSTARAWALAMGSVLCYSVLLLVAQPLEMREYEGDRRTLYTAGMWLSYFVTSVVIASVLVRIALALREGEKAVAAAQRKAINDEHILRIGALAAGAAHEIASPLGAVAVVLEDLAHLHAGDPVLARNLECAGAQLAACRQTLTSLLSYGNSTFAAPLELTGIDAFVNGCVEHFRLRRPDAEVALRVFTQGDPPRMYANQALRQAITSLMDNAADVSPKAVVVEIEWDAEWLHVGIRDRGPGIPPDLADGLGRLLFTTKESGKGNGLGLYLAHLVVVRFGGTIAFANDPGGGALARISLPVPEPVARRKEVP